MRKDNPSVNLNIIGNSVDLLKDRFNADKGKIRFLALLSPTCPL